ncbi:NACHT, LRR and PYD domains-containing protein 1b allele 3 [Amia ocellicauda]|uniref:NACHT, LRR and PYD domains-containing protein 1b allele 3 n=1 Tax=Amia ocellicauda TaxID=2972642 RepID=UPI0034640216
MEILNSCRSDLCEWLSADPSFIIEKAEDILTVKDNKEIAHLSCNKEKMTRLLDIIIRKGENQCRDFLTLLSDVQDHYPQLKKLFSTNREGSISQSVHADGGSNVVAPIITSCKVTDMSVNIQSSTSSRLNNRQPTPSAVGAKYSSKSKPGICSTIVACNGSNAVAPLIQGSDISGLNIHINQSPAAAQPDSSKNVKEATASVKDKMEFLKTSLDKLVQKVTNVDPIIDQVSVSGFPAEAVANIRAQTTSQKKMRQILDYTRSTKAAEVVFSALLDHEPDVMEDIMKTY